MQLTLRAKSILRQVMVFDPAAIEHRFARGRTPELQELMREVRVGNAALCTLRPRGARDVVLRVYVDERPDVALTGRANRPASGFLSVPGGAIVASGLERRGQLVPEPPDRREASTPDVSELVAIPPAEYAADGFHIDWTDPHAPRRPRLTLRRLDEGLQWGSTGGVLLSVAALLLLRPHAPVVLFHALMAVGLTSLLLLGSWPRLRQRLRAAEDAFPDAVLVLTRLPVGTRTTFARGCSFGPELAPARGFDVVMPGDAVPGPDDPHLRPTPSPTGPTRNDDGHEGSN